MNVGRDAVEAEFAWVPAGGEEDRPGGGELEGDGGVGADG